MYYAITAVIMFILYIWRTKDAVNLTLNQVTFRWFLALFWIWNIIWIITNAYGWWMYQL